MNTEHRFITTFRSFLPSVALFALPFTACDLAQNGSPTTSTVVKDSELRSENRDCNDPPEAYDLVENMARFRFAPSPVFDDGMPAYGNPFITEGYIYPHGFLDEQPGVDERGQPTFPDAVIGTWTCRGWFVGNGAQTTEGPMVVTHQWITFHQDGGIEHESEVTSLATDGFEQMGPPLTRAVTGGTGAYSGVRGQVTQTFLGLNPSGGVNLRQNLNLVY